MFRSLALFTVLVLVGCGREASLQEWDCPNGACNACVDDSECRITHNPCQPTAYCGNVDDNVAVTLEGCSAALEYETPPADECICDASTCTAMGIQ
jgi:hypothetical protein